MTQEKVIKELSLESGIELISIELTNVTKFEHGSSDKCKYYLVPESVLELRK